MKTLSWSLICISTAILQHQCVSAQIYHSSNLSALNAAIGEELDNTVLNAPMWSASADDNVSVYPKLHASRLTHSFQ